MTFQSNYNLIRGELIELRLLSKCPSHNLGLNIFTSTDKHEVYSVSQIPDFIEQEISNGVIKIAIRDQSDVNDLIRSEFHDNNIDWIQIQETCFDLVLYNGESLVNFYGLHSYYYLTNNMQSKYIYINHYHIKTHFYCHIQISIAVMNYLATKWIAIFFAMALSAFF